MGVILNWRNGVTFIAYSNIPKTKETQILRYLETKETLGDIEKTDKPFSAESALSFLIASNIRTEAAVEALTEIIAEIRSKDLREKKLNDVLGEISLTKAKVAKYLFHEFGA